MTLRVVGAGLGRTGTMSLKIALERLLGGPCYHMIEVFGRPEHIRIWHDAALGAQTDWNALFEGFVAAVDWPPVTFWQEISKVYPDALILLSVRDGADWWQSCDRTIFEGFRRDPPPGAEAWRAMVGALLGQGFAPDLNDRSAVIAAFERHNEIVRREAPRDRLLEWRPGDGWEPICKALGVAVPDEPFPHANTTAEFRARFGFDV